MALSAGVTVIETQELKPSGDKKKKQNKQEKLACGFSLERFPQLMSN